MVDLSFFGDVPPEVVNAPVAANLTVGQTAVTAAFVQFEPATHPMLALTHGERDYDLTAGLPYAKRNPPLSVDNPTARLQDIARRFFQDYFAGMTPTVYAGQ
jgi:hypothetical protein